MVALRRLRRSKGGSGRLGKLRATSDPTYESRIQVALNGLENDLYKSVAAAARAQNISCTTLNDRRLGTHRSRKEVQSKQQILTPAQEDVLVDWCKLASSSANPIHPSRLRAQVKDLTGRCPSKNWHRYFLRRHKTLIVSRPRGLDPKHAKNFNKTTIGEFFEMRKQLEEQYGGIPPDHHWNIDEKGVQMGGGRKNTGKKYIYSDGDTDRYRIHSDNLELVTIIECVNAAGAKMPPWFVHTTGPPPDIRHLEGKVGGLSFSESGWTDREIAAHWFEHHFIPCAEKHHVDPEKPIVLTLDGHDSHETSMFKAIAYKHGIIVHAFPSKTTHKTQPLDVGVFACLQRAWTNHCDKRLSEGVEINRYNFIHEYITIHDVITPELVQKAFKKTGLYPLDPSVFGDKDFAPSLASSNMAHVPSSYPTEILSSPISPSDELKEEADWSATEDPDFDPMEIVGCDVDGIPISGDQTTDDESESGEINGPSTNVDPENQNHFLLQTSEPSQPPQTPSDSCPPSHVNDHSQGAGTMYTTRSTTSMSPGPARLPVIPSFAQAMALTKEELWNELQRMYQQDTALFESNRMLTSQLEAANAHCTLAMRALSQSRLELDNVKKKKQPQKSVKLRARFVTLPELKEDFEKAEEERREKEKAEGEKLAKKKADGEVRLSQIEQDIRSKMFDSLSTFRRKDDYITLAGALGISREGTVEELKTRIKDYLADPSHADIAQNPRFAALFQAGVKARTRLSAPTQNTPSHTSEPLNFHITDVTDPLFLQPSSAMDQDTRSYPHPTLQSHHDTYSTYDRYSHHHTVVHTPTFDASQVASSSNLDRQPQFSVNAGIHLGSSYYLPSTY